MKPNNLNIHFINELLEQVLFAMNAEADAMREHQISKWGVSDDFIFSELLSSYFQEHHPSERKAAMYIVRSIINASAEAYHELLEDGYMAYEEALYNVGELDGFINNLKTTDEPDNL